MRYVKFEDIPLGARFTCNGNRWRKVSKRTARMESGRLFFFKAKMLCSDVEA